MAASVGDVFKPGQKAPQPDIYDVIHDPVQPSRHHVTRGDCRAYRWRGRIR